MWASLSAGYGASSKNNKPFAGLPAGDQGELLVSGLDAILKSMLSLTRVIDAINIWIGRHLSWLVIAAVLVSAINAVVRKIFDTSSNSFLELQWVLFSVVFLMCSPWTLIVNEHVRIDIVNNLLPNWLRNTIELVGHALFLLPLTVVMIVTSVPFFLVSYHQNEQSLNAGGLPQWPSKALIMIAFILLFIQAISELIKRIAIMRGLMEDPHAGQKSSAEVEAEEIISAIEKH